MQINMKLNRFFTRLPLALLAAFLLTPCHVNAEDARSFDLPLWQDGAPGANGTEPKDVPMAFVRLPKSDVPTAALVICPGGGYGGLAMDHEGHQMAEWANELGMAAIICDYRHRGKGYGHPAPSQDAMRAVRLVRANAKAWNVDPDKVGIMGFSAGGHLTSTVLTLFDRGDSEATDPIARESSRPDFGVLCYPVIVFGHAKVHSGSVRNLLGENPDPELVESLNTATRVTADTPPTFVFHTFEDVAVPPENALAFYAAMVKQGVPGELHFYEKGPHGVGLAHKIPGTSDWSNALKRWLEVRNFLPVK